MTDNTPSKIPDKRPASPAENGPRKRHKADPPDFSQADEVVTFLIGPFTEGATPKTFLVHKEIVCYHSPVLNAAFNSGFVEGQTQTYKLEDVNQGTFKLFVQWLYFQKLALAVFEEDYDSEEHITDQDMEVVTYQQLVELWVLSDRLGIPILQNFVLQTIRRISDKINRVPTIILAYVYENSSEDSKLRQFFVNEVGSHANESFFGPKYKSRYPHQMLLDLAIWYTQPIDEAKEYTVEDFFVLVETQDSSKWA
ncbi:hypothetical protein LSUE1_G005766 [Lachnellula suecica]|uniref:BTB domain-containing protein n=1 Tax=Lachnellula suecica TaxID=602035 RepID=A0A8T9BZP0_9HELO|nr:hypothetical protein LSUE1_G005766 [Lachnellula suecica]